MLFDSLDDMANDFIMKDTNIVTEFKSRKHDLIRSTIKNLKHLDTLFLQRPLNYKASDT